MSSVNLIFLSVGSVCLLNEVGCNSVIFGNNSQPQWPVWEYYHGGHASLIQQITAMHTGVCANERAAWALKTHPAHSCFIQILIVHQMINLVQLSCVSFLLSHIFLQNEMLAFKNTR